MTTYAFVDLGYLLREIDAFTGFVFPGAKELRPDMQCLKKALGEASRMFIYYAAEQTSQDSGDAKQAERIAQQQRIIDWLGSVQRLEGVHVRWGDVKYKPRKKERIQKRVDVMLAVDMMKHAFRKTMDHAVLLTGDLDFHPLVEELVETGCHVTVAACRWSSAGALLDAADAVIELDSIELARLLLKPDDYRLPHRWGDKRNYDARQIDLQARGRRGIATMTRGGTVVGLGDPPDRLWTGSDMELLKKIVLYEIEADADAWKWPFA